MGAGEPQVFAQQLHEQRARVDIGGYGFAVHRQGNGCHGLLLEDKIPVKRLDLRVGLGRPLHSGAEIMAILPVSYPGTIITVNRGLAAGQGSFADK